MPNHLKGKKILILGLGQYPKGSGISAALFAARGGADVLVTDQKSESELRANVKRLRRFRAVRFHLGGHRLADVRWADVIIRHQRVRQSSSEMRLATALGKRIESAESLFFTLCPCPIVGITGTRGKSTTATLVAEMLRASGRKTWLGGNILISPLTFLANVKREDIVVLELSSWQLEVIGMNGMSPHIACITNLMRDHLDTYDGMEEYAEAKAQIFRHQQPTDVLIVNGDDAYGKRWSTEAPGRVLLFSKKQRLFTRLTLRGEHNRMNALAASMAAKTAGASSAAIKKVLGSFKGLPDRQEIIAVKRGVTYVNDTTATTPDGTIAAIKTFVPQCLVLRLILGGADKKLIFDELAKELTRYRTDIVVLPGTAHAKLTRSLQDRDVAYRDVKNLTEAVTALRSSAKKGDVVLLSPGCASFGMFKNEFDRGAQFRRLARQ